MEWPPSQRDDDPEPEVGYNENKCTTHQAFNHVYLLPHNRPGEGGHWAESVMKRIQEQKAILHKRTHVYMHVGSYVPGVFSEALPN